MGSLFRSEEMSLLQFFIQYEAAHAVVSEIGQTGFVQFIDLNPNVSAFQRKFVHEVRRMDELERKLRFLASQLQKGQIEAERILAPSAHLDRTIQEIDDLETKLAMIETEVKRMNANEETLNRNYLELNELKHILKETASFFEESEGTRQASLMQLSRAASLEETSSPLLSVEDTRHSEGVVMTENPFADAIAINRNSVRLSFITGVLAREKMPVFEKVLWRSLRGNLFMRQTEIEEAIRDPSTDEPVLKNVFVIFSQGEQLVNKIKKICESFNATLYPCPETLQERRELTFQVMTRIEDLNNIIARTTDHRKKVLSQVAEHITSWIYIVRKEKGVFHTMNSFNFDVTRKCLIAEGWCPTKAIPDIQASVTRATERTGTNVPSIINALVTSKDPPTYNRTNKFTNAFQEIVDAYGVARYREVNPAPFSIITFPFLFAVMFGDFGHGIVMTAFALWLVIKEKKLDQVDAGEIFRTMFDGRYILLLMGIFSMYTGLIYNDIFSKSLEIIPSGWNFDNNNTATFVYAYPFGVDPAWRMAQNQLIFMNSYKMKMAIIFGVMQMSFGIILSTFNFSFFGKRVNIYLEFVPQILFMTCIFGYLCVTIIYKWCIDWSGPGASRAPNLLNMLIYMFLSPGSVKSDEQLYPGQGVVQAVLLLIAVVCIPWMLFAKPIYLRRQAKNNYRYQNIALSTSLEEADRSEGLQNIEARTSTSSTNGQVETFEFGEVMVHQVIHTIEFCLGCISNTASYLRLWALSLAHAQLSEVLWTMVMGSIVNLGFIGMFLGFAVWFALTIAILLIMESLSAFLHALRLHWVEFNNKFYEGSGYKFEPFSFNSLMKTSDD